MRAWWMLTATLVGSSALAQDSTLPDPVDQLQKGQCEGSRATTARVVGADQTFTGRLLATPSGQVSGIEQRHLTPNQTWRTTAAPDGTVGQDCVITWKVEGRIGPPNACRDCDLSVAFEANLDPARSTCHQRLMADGAHFRGSYDLKKNADGTLAVYFSNSGNALGTGHWSNDEMVWISDHRCVWM